jgi:hypothetical protein
MKPAAVFLSHAHADKDLAAPLASALTERGLRVWIDDRELRLGDSVIERVSQAIAEGDFLVAIVSPDSTKSEWCRRELALAANKGINEKSIVVLPVRYRSATMPASLADRYWVDADHTDVATLADRIAADIQRHRGGDSNVATVAWLESTVAIFNSESDAERARWYFTLKGSLRNDRMDVRIDGGAHHSTVEKLCRIGALVELRRSRRFMFYTITDCGRSLFDHLRSRDVEAS